MWTIVVSIVALYNLLAIVARATFDGYNIVVAFAVNELLFSFADFWQLWLGLDYGGDTIFLLDTLIQSRRGACKTFQHDKLEAFFVAFLQGGSLIVGPRRMLQHYRREKYFWLDMISIMPTDILCIIFPLQPLVRINRLTRWERYVPTFTPNMHFQLSSHQRLHRPRRDAHHFPECVATLQNGHHYFHSVSLECLSVLCDQSQLQE